MENRYEIRESIGQGGIGSVYRAYDHRMGRLVAIKRILIRGDDPAFEAEATKQMMAEVVALSSLQHPHIVTVFDVGEDEQGPYVVMELIDGKTLDEIIEKAPLTWNDFIVVATQSLEALLAAHDLEMIHSDLKPPNIMLSWMPSGAFRVKIVDFGLAKLIRNQSQEEIEKMESVYGSVFFMPPEQFQRKTLDERSDLYSLGCCFYQALAGTCPFVGATVYDVVDAHIAHTVRPLHEIRGDIPAWACDWVMWMINLDPAHRPATAREALALFLQNEKNDAAVAQQEAVAAQQAQRMAPPAPELAAPSPQTSALPAGMAATGAHTLAPAFGKKNPYKKLLWIAIPAAAAVLLVGASIGLVKRNEQSRQQNAYLAIVAKATQPNVKQVQLNADQLKTLFDYMAKAAPDRDLAGAYETLRKATGSGGNDVDAAIAEFATMAGLPAGIRRKLFQEVIAKRKSEGAVPTLIQHVKGTGNADEAAIAFEAIRPHIGEKHAEALLGLIATTTHEKIRLSAETRMSEIIAGTFKIKELTAMVSQAAENTGNPEDRKPFERLLAQCAERNKAFSPARPATPPATPPAAKPPATATPPAPPAAKPPTASHHTPEIDKLKEAFEAANEAGKLEIIARLAKTPGGSSHAVLRDIAGSAKHAQYKTRAIQALVELNSLPGMQSADSNMRQLWLQILWRCQTAEQKIMVLDGLAKFRAPWANALITEVSRSGDHVAAAHARKILEAQK